MQLGPGLPDLTYCTNIHAADGWRAVFARLRKYAPSLKALLAGEAPLGLGLRLSAHEAEELSGGQLAEFSSWLRREGLYVALLNGYPFGSFHSRRVKEQVFSPDWLDPRRVHYTLQLAAILGELLPEGSDGGVSTVPLSYKPWVSSKDTRSCHAIAANIKRVAEALAELYERRGKLIHIDIEPEPGGLIENTAETIRFFQDFLLENDSSGILRRHVSVCFDACHFAVEYEDPVESLRAFAAAGIGIGRVQVSSALKVVFDKSDRQSLSADLRRLAESPYLHQVIERRNEGSLRAYGDLVDALDHVDDPSAAEWRIHFHVPVFMAGFGSFGSTQDDLLRGLGAACETGYTRHLEIETYTWHVLPQDRKLELMESIEREFRWTVTAICARRSSSI